MRKSSRGSVRPHGSSGSGRRRGTAKRIVLLTTLHLRESPVHSVWYSMRNLARGYRQRGYDVLMAAQKGPHVPLSTNAPEKSEMPLLEAGGGFRTPSMLRAVVFFSQILRFKKSDLFHLYLITAADKFLYAVWLALKIKRIPFGIYFQGGPLPQGRFVDKLLLPIFLRDAAWVAAPTVWAKTTLERGMPSLINRIYVVREASPWEDSPVSHIAETEDAAPYVLFLGRQVHCRGSDLLVMAWSELCRRVPDVQLWFVGPEGHLSGHTRYLAERLGLLNRIRFLGERPRREIPELIRRSLCLVLPARHSISGTVVLEAMSLGKAVVASQRAASDFIEEGKTGLFAEPLNVKNLSDTISSLLMDPEKRLALGSRARHAILKSARSWRWEHAALRYLELFRDPADLK